VNNEFLFGLKQRLYNWNMRTARENKGWRQADLAKAVGISNSLVSHIETLRCFPTLGQAEKIANALGGTVESLFPEWLRVFKLERVVPSIEDKSISLEEATAKRLIAPALLIEPRIGWAETIDDIERRVDSEGAVSQILDTLEPRERRIIEAKFGLDKVRLPDGTTETSQCARTSGEVARKFGMTQERVWQITVEALEKLRQHRQLIGAALATGETEDQ